MKLRLASLAAVAALYAAAPLHAADEPAGEAPKILLDKSPKIVEFQLKRLTNAQLVAVERKTDDAKYRPIYSALLTRKGLERKYRQEAVDALVKLNKSSNVAELLAGIGKVPADDKVTGRELVGLLMTQKPAELAAQREAIAALAGETESDALRQAAYAALAVADGKADATWTLAAGKENGTLALVRGVELIPDGKVRATFDAKVRPLASKAPDEATQLAAIEALSLIPAQQADTFKLLAGFIAGEAGPKREAAIRSLRRLPRAGWPKDQVEPLAKQLLKVVESFPVDQRTSPAAVQAVQLGDDLAAALPAEQGAPIKKALRELGVRVVAIRTLREQMQYDLRYFAVQAGKPVQIVLENADAMPHNLVITAPGAMQDVAKAGEVMPAPNDENAKAFVPESPKVLHSTKLAQPDETLTLSFTAPTEPGEYPFVCTFPGHWLRMYGVMVVVPDLDAFDKAPKPPMDPVAKKPMDSQKNEVAEGAAAGHEHH